MTHTVLYDVYQREKWQSTLCMEGTEVFS
uniref:Uncharacterized protein n=1 Tax=Amphimedon queenslandica TaxID=400682 RepID=A0A1X7UJ65_AMPQE